MLSLDNAYNEAELRAWEERVAGGLAAGERVRYVCELKLDGLSLALQYEAGSRRRSGAAQRGDAGGWHGGRRCHHQCADDPQRAAACECGEAEGRRGCQRVFEVRGEVVLPQAAFEKMNEERVAAGMAPAANPRNAAAGTIRTLEPNIVAQRRLEFFAYFLLQRRRDAAGRAEGDAGGAARCRVSW